MVLGIAAALCAGLACGLVNGALVTVGRIPSFIATYGMLWIANGIAYVFMKGEVIYGLPEGFRFIGAGLLWGIPVPVSSPRHCLSPCTSCCTRPCSAAASTRLAEIRSPRGCPACRSSAA